MLDSTLLDYANIFDVLFHVDIRHQQLCASSYFLLSLYLGHCYINPTFLSRFSKITGQIQMIIIYFLLRQLQCLIMMILWKFIWNLGRLLVKNGILLPKLSWPTVRKKCSSDREKLLNFEAEGQEFAKILRSLEQFIQTVKGQNNFW